MSFKLIRTLALCLVTLASSTALPHPQQNFGSGTPAAATNLFKRMPDEVQPLIAALGERASQPGREHTTLAGRWTEAGGNSFAARVSLQLPASVGLQNFRAGQGELRFESASTPSAMDPDDAMILETWVTDTVEGMFDSLRNGATLLVMGRNVQPSGMAETDSALRYDVFAVTDSVRTRRDGPVRTKFYCFDSRTALLERTTYQDGNRDIEVRFSGWTERDGSAYPGRIARYGNGQLVFSFVVDNVTAGPAIAPAAFR